MAVLRSRVLLTFLAALALVLQLCAYDAFAAPAAPAGSPVVAVQPAPDRPGSCEDLHRDVDLRLRARADRHRAEDFAADPPAGEVQIKDPAAGATGAASRPLAPWHRPAGPEPEPAVLQVFRC